MGTVLLTHPACLEHVTGTGHPERPERLQAVMRALEGPSFAWLERREAPRASVAQLRLAHPDAFVAGILEARPPEGELVALDADTSLSAGSAEAALRAAGGACAAVDAVLGGEAATAFAAVRPPGHHAEPDRAMGFCLFSNAAIAALHARARWGVRRVAVVDFDVHHGNGTQAIAARDRDFFFASSHQMPCYPGTGNPNERGVAENVVNVALPPGSGSVAFRGGWERVILPALEGFGAEIVIVSAGFDAHLADPLAQLALQATDFGWVTREILRVTGGRAASVLEGGYDLAALAASAAAHVAALR